MQEEQDQLREELESARIQLGVELSKLGVDTIHEELQAELRTKHNKRVQLLSKIDKATKRSIDLQVQLTKAWKQPVAANIATVASIDNYWPRGVGPKRQLTGKDSVEYAP